MFLNTSSLFNKFLKVTMVQLTKSSHRESHADCDSQLSLLGHFVYLGHEIIECLF